EVEEIETLNIELDHKVTKLVAENEHLKQTYKQLYDSIKSSRVRSKEKCDDLTNKVNLKSAEVSDLNASLQEKVLVITALKEQLNKLKGKAVLTETISLNPIDPELLKVDVAPLVLKLHKNRTAHTDYIRHTQEEVATLREIVKKKKVALVGMCAIVLTSMTAKTYKNKLYLSSTSSTVIYDNDDIQSLQELRSVISLVEPNKEMMMVGCSQPRERTVKNLLLWARNRNNDMVNFQCKVMIEDIKRKSGWNYPSCGGEKCRKTVSRQAGKFLCETCNRTVDYPILRYRLEVVIADDTTHTTIVMFNEIATELLNCFQTAIRNLIGTTHVMELKSHTYYEHECYESFTCWKINLADLVDDEASSSNQLITVDDLDPSLKRLARQPSVCTPSKLNEEKRKKRYEPKDSNVDEVSCSGKDPHEINANGPVDKKKRKICIVPGLWSEKMPKFHQLTFTIKDEEDAKRA
nr:hypothetical protein [Tanacetum cinerariifolium]